MNYWIACFVLTVAAYVSRSDLPAAEGLPAERGQPVATPRLAGIGFETAIAGPLVNSSFEGATWTAERGHAEILGRLARSGEQCLHLLGGEHSEIQFEVTAQSLNKNFDRLTFAAERWTSRAPFSFRVETRLGDKWQEIYNGDVSVKVGRPYLNRVEISLPEGARRFRMTCTSPHGTGVLIDDMNLVEAKPMTVTRVLIAQQTAPMLIGQKNSPLLQLEIEAEGSLTPRKLTGVEFRFPTGRDFLREVHFQNQPLKPGLDTRFKVDIELQPG